MKAKSIDFKFDRGLSYLPEVPVTFKPMGSGTFYVTGCGRLFEHCAQYETWYESTTDGGLKFNGGPDGPRYDNGELVDAWPAIALGEWKEEFQCPLCKRKRRNCREDRATRPDEHMEIDGDYIEEDVRRSELLGEEI